MYHFNKVACVYQPKALLRLCVLLHPNCILSYIFSAFHDFLYWGAVFSLDDWDLNAVHPAWFGSDCQQWQRCILGSFRFPLPWTFMKRFGMNHYYCVQGVCCTAPLYYYSGQSSGFEFFQVSRCLDLGLNHFGNFSYSIMKALNLWKFHLGRSGLKNVVGA